MDAEGCELGPFTPVSDALVLAAIQRAQRHGHKHIARWHVAEHLGFVHNSATTRRLRPQLESLRVAGSLERSRKHGQYQWALTSKGSRRLAAARRAGRVGELPESPQHRRWRHAREKAEQRIDDFRTLTYQTLDAAEAVAEPADGPGSETWFEMGDRLAAIFWLMGSATHCLTEWPEPDDARSDRDDASARRRGRRGAYDWEAYEKRAKGGRPGV